MNAAQWQAQGVVLAKQHKNIQFQIADWIVAGLALHKGKDSAVYDKAQELFPNYTRETLMHFATTARTFPTCTRVQKKLSFGHYRVVQSLPKEQASAWLYKAATAPAPWPVQALRERIQEFRATERAATLPAGTYRVIYADPPWNHGGGSGRQHNKVKANMSPIDHYPCMDTEDICKMELPKIAPDAVLFLWAVSPMLPEALQVLDAWGFKYKALFVWDKVKHNVGYYNSVRHELLLIGTRGSCLPDTHKLAPSVQHIPRGEHSVKPPHFRDLIDTLYPKGQRVELFARGTLPQGWDGFGNEYLKN